MLNLNYKKLHEDFIENAKSLRASAEEKSFGIDLMEAFSKAISKEIINQADSYSTPGYVNFCKDLTDNDIRDKKLNKQVMEALRKRRLEKAKVKEDSVKPESVTKEMPAEQFEKNVPAVKVMPKEDFVKAAPVAKEEGGEDAEKPKKAEYFVYSSKSGKKYHKEDCIYRKPNFEEMTIDKAKELGKTPCSTCFNR